MREETFGLIKTFTETQATSGFESNMSNNFETAITPFVDRIEKDGLGGVFGIREHSDPNAARVMVAAHLDEVGFMITHIMPNGLFKVQAIGGWNPYVISAQRFTIQTQKDEIVCVSSSIPPHLLRGKGEQKQLAVTDLLFDAGFVSAEEAMQYGVRVGDPVVPQVETIVTANQRRVISKAWDNRYGCSVIVEALQALKKEALNHTFIAGATVQEEVGLRGAKPATYLMKPDLFLAVDCSPADDLVTKQQTFGHLDEGFLLRIMDPGMIMPARLKEFLLDVAHTHRIPYQYYVSQGQTDAGQVHTMNAGVPSAVIGVCARYIHTHQTLFSIADYEAAREMVVQTIKALDKTTVETILGRPLIR